jgi:hypothetical protein
MNGAGGRTMMMKKFIRVFENVITFDEARKKRREKK